MFPLLHALINLVIWFFDFLVLCHIFGHTFYLYLVKLFRSNVHVSKNSFYFLKPKNETFCNIILLSSSLVLNYFSGDHKSSSNKSNWSLKMWIILKVVIPLQVKQVREFIEIRHKKISPTHILSTLGCLFSQMAHIIM